MVLRKFFWLLLCAFILAGVLLFIWWEKKPCSVLVSPQQETITIPQDISDQSKIQKTHQPEIRKDTKEKSPDFVIQFDCTIYAINPNFGGEVKIIRDATGRLADVLRDELNANRGGLEWVLREAHPSTEMLFSPCLGAGMGYLEGKPGTERPQCMQTSFNVPTRNVQPGEYDVTFVIYNCDKVLRSAPMPITLVSEMPPSLTKKEIPKGRFMVKFDKESYIIASDTTVQVTIEGVEGLPEGREFTKFMLSQTHLRWDYNNGEDDPYAWVGASSPRCGYGAGEPSTPPVKFPVTLNFNLQTVFLDEFLQTVHPGMYNMQMAVSGPTLGLYSDRFKITLIGPKPEPYGKIRLIVKFDKNTYTIAPDTIVQVTIEGIEGLLKDKVFVKSMLDHAYLEWESYDPTIKGHSPLLPGGNRFRIAESPPVKLPEVLNFNLQDTFFHVDTRKVHSGAYNVRVVIVNAWLGALFFSDPTKITLVQR